MTSGKLDSYQDDKIVEQKINQYYINQKYKIQITKPYAKFFN